MTHYTLFIDESGSFGAEGRKETWIVGGLLIPMTFLDFEKHIKDKIKPIQEKFRLQKIENFHATDIRQNKENGHDIVREVFLNLIELLNKMNKEYYFITTINHNKISSNNSERNYRLMLLDLIIQSEKIIEDSGNDISGFELIIASRTINRERLTDYHHIDNEIIKSLASAIESDLVAMGRIYLLGNKLQYELKNAEKTWGLIYSDFLCNLTYNKRFEENKKILDDLEKSKKLVSYQTFSSPELRKILSNEVNQNYSSAIFDCLRILDRKNNHQNEAKEILIRILRTALITSGTTGVKVNFDAILEKIWRDKQHYKDYDKKSKLLLKLSEYINELHKDYKLNNINMFNFKLNNMVLLCYNHIADTIHAYKILKKQNDLMPTIIANPDYYGLILDYYIRSIEIYVNSLQFKKAKEQAIKYDKMIADYFDAWQLMGIQNTENNTLSSETYIRSKTNLIRTNVLNFDNKKENGEDILNSIESILEFATKPQDISRLKCQKLLLLCKLNRTDEAITLAFDNFEKTLASELDISFDYFFLLYAINQKLLKNEDNELIKKLTKIIDNKNNNSINENRYPYPIILRELSLFYFLSNNKNKAQEYLKISNQKILEILKSNSETKQFFKLINSIQEKLIKNQKIDLNTEMKDLNMDYIAESINLKSNDRDILFELRNYITS